MAHHDEERKDVLAGEDLDTARDLQERIRYSRDILQRLRSAQQPPSRHEVDVLSGVLDEAERIPGLWRQIETHERFRERLSNAANREERDELLAQELPRASRADRSDRASRQLAELYKALLDPEGPSAPLALEDERDLAAEPLSVAATLPETPRGPVTPKEAVIAISEATGEKPRTIRRRLIEARRATNEAFPIPDQAQLDKP